MENLNSEFRGLIGELFRNNLFSKAEEDFLLRGIIAKELVKNFITSKEPVGKFVLSNFRFKIDKKEDVQKVIDIMEKHGYTEPELVITEEYLSNWNHNVFKSGGILNRLEINKRWDSDFNVNYFIFNVNIEYGKDELRTTAFLDLMNFAKDIITAEYNAGWSNSSLGYLLDPWTYDYALLTKLNIKSGLDVLLEDIKVRKMEVEIVDRSALYMFYEFYPEFKNTKQQK